MHQRLQILKQVIMLYHLLISHQPLGHLIAEFDAALADLESALSAETGKSIQEGGTASGAVHRTWGELKGKLGGSDHTLLDTAEQGEDVAKKAYEEALKVSGIPASITSILRKQQPHIQQSHDKVKAMRDAAA